MTNNSTRRPAAGKPKKPSKDFPLGIHRGTGYWCRKVRGRTHYFGKIVDDPKGVAALERWLEVKDDLLAGREPREKTEGMTVADLVNRFLSSKADARDNGELSSRTWADYKRCCGRLVKYLGKARVVADLVPADFARLRRELAKNLGLTTITVEIQRVRTIFKFADDEDLVEHAVRFGQSFQKPKKEVVRKAKEASRAEFGDRMFSAAELRRVLAECPPTLRVMTLLAINGGMGQTDLSKLPTRAVDLDAAMIDFPRPKTGVARRIPLWPESVEAIRQYLTVRPKAKQPADTRLLFLTSRGNPWLTVSEQGEVYDGVGQTFSRMLARLGIKRPGVNFYAMRHSFRTIADELPDVPAIDKLMGHTRDGIAAAYVERISDDRLRAVTSHVRQWLLGGDDPQKTYLQFCDRSDRCDRTTPPEEAIRSQLPHGSQNNKQNFSVLRLYGGER